MTPSNNHPVAKKAAQGVVSLANTPSEIDAKNSPTTTPNKPVFHSKEIGTKAAKEEDLFEKQNAWAKENRQKQEQRRKIFIIVAFAIIALLVAGIVIWLLVTREPNSQQQPSQKDEGITAEIDPVVQAGNDWYSLAAAKDESMKENGGEEVDLSALGKEADFADSGKEVLEIALDRAKTDDEKMGIKFAQMYYACANEDYETARDIADTVQPDDMNIEQQIAYYNIIMDFEGELGNKQRMEEAYAKITELAYIAGGVGSPYEESEGEN